MTRRHRRGHEIFWQLDSVQVKILWLGFKDKAAGILYVDNSSDGHDDII
jgi:hypothetical protein